MFVRRVSWGMWLAVCLFPSVTAAPGPSESPSAFAVDRNGYTYAAGVSTTAAAGHAAGAIYVAKTDPSSTERIYTAYLSGSGFARVTGVAVDDGGNAYIAGYTASAAFPTIGGVQKSSAGGLDIFVAKLDAKGRSWLYATYLGGAGDDVANGIAVDAQGNAYITGQTASADFPLKNAAERQRSGESSGFLAEIDSAGAALLYSTYLGSAGQAIAVDAGGAAVVAGSIGGKQAFILKTATDGSAPQYLRAIDGAVQATSLAVDSQGAIYVAGSTGQAVLAARFSADGTPLYTTTVASLEGETAPAIAADALGNAYVAGGRVGRLVRLSAAGSPLSSETLPAAGAPGIGLGMARSGSAIVAGQAFAAHIATCSFRVSGSAQAVAAAGGAGSIAVESAPECGWQAEANAPWIELGASAEGNGALAYRVAPNQGPARSAAITVGAETVTVRQAAGAQSNAAGAIRDNPGFRATPLTGCDDCSAAEIADLGFAIDFYGRGYTQAWVNANGNLTFDAPSASYAPEPLAALKTPAIAPFWADVDTRGAAPGAIAYGRDMVDGHAAFAATWTAVGRYPSRQESQLGIPVRIQRNTFQVVLIDRSDVAPGAFDIEMNYAGVEWDAAEASGRGVARAGFTNGTGAAGTWQELPGSGTRAAMLDGGPASPLGRHIFSVRPAAVARANPNLQVRSEALGSITEFPVPITNSSPYGIAAGSDGALWFTDQAGFVGRMTTAGAVTEHGIASTAAGGMTAGPDGALWFTDSTQIGSTTTADAVTEYPIPTTSSGPNGIAVGPDGRLWFAEYNAAKIGAITTSGVLTEYPLQACCTGPVGVAAGPDGAIWFTDRFAGKIGRMTTNGAYTEFAIPTNGSQPWGIALGPDGALWFTEQNGNKIGRITTSGAVTEYPLATSNSAPTAITAGPDGALWFTQYLSNQIGRITTAGQITEYPIPTASSRPVYITAGPDGALWFAEWNVGKIGRIATAGTNPPALSIAKSHAGSFAPGQQGAVYTVTVSNAAGAGQTVGAVTVTESLPAGLTLVSMTGSGWTCPGGGVTCTRSDVLGGGSSYPPISVTVNVAAQSTSPQLNEVIVTGGGSAQASAIDSTVISAAAAVGSITEYPVAITNSSPYGIAAGPDGALWFTDQAGFVVRMTTTGAITEHAVSSTAAAGIVAGPDGALWLTDSTQIGRITTAGALTEFPIPTTSSGPNGMTVGPDGRLWFAEYNASKIGAITTSGVLTEYALPSCCTGPVGLTTGPDGAIWFTDRFAGKIGRMTTSGAFVEFTIPTGGSQPWGIALGTDGALWFTEQNGNKIGRITTAGDFTEYPLATPNSQPTAIVTGPDGALWFTQYLSNQIGRITTAGELTEYPIPTASSRPVYLTVGPDGALWFAEWNTGKIGRIVTGKTDAPVLSIGKSHAGNFAPGQTGAAYTVTVANAAGAGPTSGTVTVTENLPSGLTLVSMSGGGWTCGGNTCTRGDALAGGGAYPAIAVTVNVAANAASPQINSVSVAGGGSAGASATDSTVISSVTVGSMTEFPVPTASSTPYGIAAGPDGALWFTMNTAAKLGRITTAGAITTFSVTSTGAEGIAAGPDGDLWFTDSANIGRITTTGSLTNYPIPTTNSGPNGINVGPDGRVWFAEYNGSKIGAITTGGVLTEYALPACCTGPLTVVTGPDGALWFTDRFAGKIGRMTTSGSFVEYTIPTNGSQPVGIALGADGALWFTEQNGNKIGRLTTLGDFTEYPIATANSEPTVIVAGPDGALWFTQFLSNQIGRITTAGLITEYTIPTASSRPVYLAVGPDNAIWFTESNTNKIGRVATGFTLSPALSIVKSHTGNFTPGQQGATYTVTVSNTGAAATSGTVTMVETVPSGLPLVAMSGTGWTCPTGGTICTRGDSLSPNAAYLPITVTVNVAANAASPQVNAVSVSGGGSAPANATDSTVISSSACALTLGANSASLPATGTSTPAPCPDTSQPNCGFAPEVPRSFSVTTAAGCPWTAASSSPQFLAITSGASGSGPGSVAYTLVNNTHTLPQAYTITLTSGAASASYTITQAGSGNSQVYREVYALYEQLLGRDPDPAGFAFWTGSGGAGLGQMADSFLTSPEAYNSNFAVIAAYQAATGAPPTFAQFAAAVSAVRGGAQTVGGLFTSLLNAGYSATTLYGNLLNRAPVAAEVTAYNTNGPAATFQTLIGYPSNITPVGDPNSEFESTGAFHTDHTNGLYMNLLYYTILSRDPDPAGLTFWTGIANGGGAGLLFQGNAGFGTRIQILGPGTPNQGFIGSPEFQGLFAN